MNYYTGQHKYYCGIDLHARNMYLCVLDQQADVCLLKNIKSRPTPFLDTIEPFMDNVVVAVECMFTWYWLADLCYENDIPFVLGHALYMKAIHGGKAGNDRIDARKIAGLLKGGMFPTAYVYPAQWRSTRDLLRRRMHLVQKRAELIRHVINTNHQYCMPDFEKRVSYQGNREGIAERFEDPMVRKSVEADIAVTNFYDRVIADLELTISKQARVHDPQGLYLLKTIPGIGPILSSVILYEVHDIHRFPSVQNFASYCRLVKCSRTSAGKHKGIGGAKIGNVHLKWAFSEAATLFKIKCDRAKPYVARLEKKHGKGKATGILAHKLGRTVYTMLKRKQAFDVNRFFAS
ncbi:MAG: IS110 family transposase [Chloroflexi bacterium]|nr:IS110 family transposase [Chloroflexota bacterium]